MTSRGRFLFLWASAILLAVMGFLLTAFLARAHFMDAVDQYCGGILDCGSVLRSPWGRIGGLPTAFYGSLYYLSIIILILLIPAIRSEIRRKLLPIILLQLVAGLTFSICLTLYAVFVLHTLCGYCTSSLAVIALLTIGFFFHFRSWEDGSTPSVEFDTVKSDPELTTASVKRRAVRRRTLITTVSLLILLMFFQAGIKFEAYRRGVLTTAGHSGAVRADEKIAYSPPVLDGIGRSDTERTIGNPAARVVITEYFDFECGFCRRLSGEVFPRVLEDYIRSGRVSWRVRHYPLPSHAHALQAANAAECAGEQSRFWEFKHALMRDDASFSKVAFMTIAREVDVADMEQFGQCLDEARYSARVRKDYDEGSARGIRGTPTLMLGDEMLRGYRSYDDVRASIEFALDPRGRKPVIQHECR